MKRPNMQWLDYLKQDHIAYEDFVAFLKGRARFHLGTYDSSKDIIAIHRAQGAREELTTIQRLLTEEEKENYARAERHSRTGS